MLQIRQRIDRGVYGGHRLRHIALGVALGLLGGSLTGWNFSFVAVLILAVLVNAHTRLLVASWAAGVVLASLMSGATHFLGVAVLDWAGVGRAVAMLGDGPIVALWGWDQYELVGGAVLAVVLALPAARLATRVALSLAERGGLARESTTGANAGGARRSRLTRFATRFLFGFTSRERECRRGSAGGWSRPCGLSMALLVIVAAGLAPATIGPRLVARELLRQLSKANGAEVAAGDVELSLSTGSFSVRDLQVADSHHPHRDRLRVGLLTGQLSPGALLRGRLQIERVALDQVRVDVARHRLARSSAPHAPASDIRSSANASLSVDTSVEIERYVRAWPSVRHDLEWLQRLIAAVESVSKAHLDVAGDGSARPRRSDLGQPQPRVAVARLRASDLPAGLQLGRKSSFELTNLTSRPDLAGRPTRLKVVIPRLAAQLSARFHLTGDSHHHSVKFTADDLDLAELLDGRHEAQTVAAAGRVSLSGEGWMDSHRVELPLRIELTSLDVDVRSHDRLGLIDGDVWSQGLRRLGAVQTDVLLSGPWSLVTLTVEPARVVDQFKHQLRAAGEYHLVDVIDDQLAQSLTPDRPTQVLQAAALESEPPASAGVSELCDDEPAGDPAGGEVAPGERIRSETASSELAAGGPTPAAAAAEALASGEPASDNVARDGVGADEAAPLTQQLMSSLAADEVYPTTATAYDDGDDYDARYDAPPPEPAPRQPQTSAVARPVQGSRRTAQLPGPLGLAVGHDALDGPEHAAPDNSYHTVKYAPPRPETFRQPVPPAEPPEPPAASAGESRYVPPSQVAAPSLAPYAAVPDSTAPYPAARQPVTTYGTMPDDFPNGPAEPELDAGEEPQRVVRPSLLTRWSNGLRNRFARKPARSAEAQRTTVEPPDYDGPVFDAPAYEAASDDEPDKPLAADHPWYKRLFR